MFGVTSLVARNAKTAIRETVLDLLDVQELATIKVTQVAERAQINRVTFYRHYDSIYDVVQEIEDEFIDGFSSIARQFMMVPLDDRYFNQPHPLQLACVRYIGENRSLVLTLFGPYGDGHFRYRCEGLIRNYLVQKAIDERYLHIRDELSQEYMASGTMGCMVAWLCRGCKPDAEEFTMMLYRNLFSKAK